MGTSLANAAKICSTLIRRPRTVGFPAMTLGLKVIRSMAAPGEKVPPVGLLIDLSTTPDRLASNPVVERKTTAENFRAMLQKDDCSRDPHRLHSSSSSPHQPSWSLHP